jgi:thiamine-phosphate pyrophosphorylase
MYKKICITNRHLVTSDFASKMEQIARSDVDMIILREKDLKQEKYEVLACEVLEICKRYNKICMLHTFIETAKKLQHPYIHLTMADFVSLPEEDRNWFQMIGVSTHSVEEAIIAENMGASYVTASHIFATKCKEGLKPKGLLYLQNVVNAVKMDVYALGGIHPDNIEECIRAGASGVCMMSEYMK